MTSTQTRRGPKPRWTARLIAQLEPEQLEATKELAARNGRSLAAEVRAALIAHHDRQPLAAREDRNGREGPYAEADTR
jgi:hypothetical protein